MTDTNNNMDMTYVDLLYKELSYEVRGATIEVKKLRIGTQRCVISKGNGGIVRDSQRRSH